MATGTNLIVGLCNLYVHTERERERERYLNITMCKLHIDTKGLTNFELSYQPVLSILMATFV